MARIRFKSDQIFENIGYKKGPFFPEGFVLDESDVAKALGVSADKVHASSFIDRWINMGVAEDVGKDVKPSDPKTIKIVGVKTVASATPAPIPQIQKPDFSKMKLEELKALAAERGLDVSNAKTKEDVIAALELHTDV